MMRALSTLTQAEMIATVGGDDNGAAYMVAAPAGFTIMWAVNQLLNGEKPLDVLKAIF